MARLHVVGEWHGPGEEATARHLAEHLPEAWDVIANREVYDPRGFSTDLDLVVVGFRRVFVLEEKYWRGRVEIDDGPKWVHEGRRAKNPLGQARSGARALNGRLDARVDGWERHGAEHRRDGHLLTGHVVLSHPRVHVVDDEVPALGVDAVLLLADAARRLLVLDARTSDVLPEGLRRRLIEHLVGLGATGGDGWPTELQGYIRDGDPVRRGNVTVLPVRVASGLQLELSCVAIEGDVDPEDERRVATREYEALEALATSGRAWRVRDWFRWESYVVTPFVTETDGTPLLDVGTDALDEIVADAFTALAEVHERGIAHRGLTPSSIEVGPEGRVRFRDFARSRIVGAGTVSALLEDHPSDAFAPPGSRLAWRDERDDVYSLALCLALWACGGAGDEVDHDAVRASAGYRDDRVGRALVAALDPHRERRPGAAGVVDLTRETAPERHAVERWSPPISDRYEYLSLIGAGNMGEVWHARDHHLAGRDVAIKGLPRGATLDPEKVDRFAREARLLAGLGHHPHIITLLDWGVRETDVFLAMPLIKGTDLAAELRQTGPMPLDRVAVIIGQLAQALDSAHAAGLVHRDVKPANILLDGAYHGDFVYLVDFGVASGGTVPTHTGDVLGTPPYMAPERFTPGVQDHRVDVYSLGCVLFELLTGAPPFTGDIPQVIHAHMHDPPPGPDVLPAALSDVVAIALAKVPEERYRSAGALAQGVREALDGAPAAVPPPRADALDDDLIAFGHELDGAEEALRRGHGPDGRAEAVRQRLEHDWRPAARTLTARARVLEARALVAEDRWTEAHDALAPLLEQPHAADLPGERLVHCVHALLQDGEALAVLGRDQEAAARHAEVLTLATSHDVQEYADDVAAATGRARRWLAGACADERDDDQAWEHLQQVIDAGTMGPATRAVVVDALVDQAELLVWRGEPQEAYAWFAYTVSEYGEDTDVLAATTHARLGLAEQARVLGRAAEADEVYRRIVGALGQNDDLAIRVAVAAARQGRARLLVSQGRPYQALKLLDEATRALDPHGRTHRAAVHAQCELGLDRCEVLLYLGHRDHARAEVDAVLSLVGPELAPALRLSVSRARLLWSRAVIWGREADAERAAAADVGSLALRRTGRLRVADAWLDQAECHATEGAAADKAFRNIDAAVAAMGEHRNGPFRSRQVRAAAIRAEAVVNDHLYYDDSGNNLFDVAREHAVAVREDRRPTDDDATLGWIARADRVAAKALARRGRVEEAAAAFRSVVWDWARSSSREARCEAVRALVDHALRRRNPSASGKPWPDVPPGRDTSELVELFGQDRAPTVRDEVARALMTLANIEQESGRHRAAIANQDLVLAHFDEADAGVSRLLNLCYALRDNGVQHAALGDEDEARRCWDALVDRFCVDPRPVIAHRVAEAGNLCGRSLAAAGRQEEALARHAQALARLEGRELPPLLRIAAAETGVAVGATALALGRRKAARAAYRGVVDRFDAIDDGTERDRMRQHVDAARAALADLDSPAPLPSGLRQSFREITRPAPRSTEQIILTAEQAVAAALESMDTAVAPVARRLLGLPPWNGGYVWVEVSGVFVQAVQALAAPAARSLPAFRRRKLDVATVNEARGEPEALAVLYRDSRVRYGEGRGRDETALFESLHAALLDALHQHCAVHTTQ